MLKHFLEDFENREVDFKGKIFTFTSQLTEQNTTFKILLVEIILSIMKSIDILIKQTQANSQKNKTYQIDYTIRDNFFATPLKLEDERMLGLTGLQLFNPVYTLTR